MLRITPEGFDKNLPKRTFVYSFEEQCSRCLAVNAFKVKLTVNLGNSFLFVYDTKCAKKNCNHKMSITVADGPVN